VTELVEHVSADGRVVEIVTRQQMRERLLRHRCCYVAVLTTGDEVVVHQRASWKDVYPGWWDLCFGGVCGVGEDWEPSALRELMEEAGLEAKLTELGRGAYEGDDGSVIGRVYLARSDAEPNCPDGEVVATDRVPRADLARWAEGRQVCLDSLQIVLPLLNSW
jgi:8-oxo-dGTP pyrophosphatase MutT (NUDIX family)